MSMDIDVVELGDGRDVYHEPEDRALIRTEDVYQTELDAGIEGYSKELLAIVANFTNGGKPDGYNVQAMVGRSKRGEVAVRMFAVVDDSVSDPVFTKVGFQVRGCVAMVGCASATCSMIEGKTFSQALGITQDDVERAVGGLAPRRRYTAMFAAECIKALVGDWMYKCGMSLEKMNEYLGCDESGVACLMCEHCSLRDSRVDLRLKEAMATAAAGVVGAAEVDGEEPAAEAAAEQEAVAVAEPEVAAEQEAAAVAASGVVVEEAPDAEEDVLDSEEARRELAENNALADAFDLVRKANKNSKLYKPQRWAKAGIAPDHMEAADFPAFVLERLASYKLEYAEQIEQEEREERERKESVRSAVHAVGVPPKIPNRRLAQIEADEAEQEAAAADEAEQPAIDATAEAAQAEAVVVEESMQIEPEAAAVEAPEPTDASVDAADDDSWANLNVPDGYRLEMLDGEMVLVKDDSVAPKRKEVDCAHIVILNGLKDTYLYDNRVMTDSYAHWAYLAAEDDPVVTFAECVREDSRVYPRPYAAECLKNPPFRMTDEQIEETWQAVRDSGNYPDIERTEASNGDAYYYSTQYLESGYAASLAEYDAVERPADV
mgnify:FL=1